MSLQASGEQGQQDSSTSDAGSTGAIEQGQQGSDAGASGEQKNPVQDAINKVVARERKAAEQREASLRAEMDALRSQITTKKPAADDDAAFREKVDAARKPVLEELEQERKALKSLHGRLVTSELRNAAQASVDPEEVAARLASRVRVTDSGDFEVVDADGKPEYGAKGLKSVQELVSELLAAKPYLAKAGTRDGAQYQGATPKGDVPLSQQIAAAEAKGDWNAAGLLRARQLMSLKPV